MSACRDALPECLPRGKLAWAGLRVESYGLQRASWDESGGVIPVAINRGKNIVF
jgi:hypothetical protein